MHKYFRVLLQGHHRKECESKLPKDIRCDICHEEGHTRIMYLSKYTNILEHYDLEKMMKHTKKIEKWVRV